MKARPVELLARGLLLAMLMKHGFLWPAALCATLTSFQIQAREVVESDAARAVVERVQREFNGPDASPPPGAPRPPSAQGVHARAPVRALPIDERPRTAADGQPLLDDSNELRSVSLPAESMAPLSLRDVRSGLQVSLVLDEVRSVPAQASHGIFVYPAAHSSGADLLQRVRPDGVEDYLAFETAPALPRISYTLTLGDRVAGLRLVANVLELLDASGAPRLRMAPPSIVDASRVSHPLNVQLTGCAADRSGVLPYGRAVTAPGSRTCTLTLSWREAIPYPALLDPSWTTTDSLAAPRVYHKSTTLADGRIFIMGGTNASYTDDITLVEIFDPTTKTFSTTQSASGSHAFGILQTLSDGRVLAAAGYTPFFTYTNVSEIWDPTTGAWTQTGDVLVQAYFAPGSVLLPDGRVLMVGNIFGAAPEIFDPSNNAWTETSTLPTLASYYGAAVLLTNGTVLYAGGQTSTSEVADAALFDPASGNWTVTGSLNTGREAYQLIALPQGPALAIGGDDFSGNTIASTELYDPGSNGWSAGPSLPTAAGFNSAALLADGATVLNAGGFDTNGNATGASSLILFPSLTVAPAVDIARGAATLNLVPDGHLLLAGGEIGAQYSGVEANPAELYSNAPDCVSLAYIPGQNEQGMLLFEDRWPNDGDLDFNDEAFTYNFIIGVNSSGKVTAIDATISVLAIGATIHNGLYLHIRGITPAQVSSANFAEAFVNGGSPLAPMANETELVLPIVTDTRSAGFLSSGFINTDPSLSTETPGQATYSVQINFSTPVTLDLSSAPFDLFIAQTDDYTHQIHLPAYSGTDQMNTNLFNTGDDGSNVGLNAGRWFVNQQGIPFALTIPQPISWPLETVSISSAYPNIVDFGNTAGLSSTDWYTSDVVTDETYPNVQAVLQHTSFYGFSGTVCQ